MAIIVEATVATAPHFPAAITGGPEAQACMTAALFTFLPFYFFTFQTAFPPYYILRAREGEGAWVAGATAISERKIGRIIFLSCACAGRGGKNLVFWHQNPHIYPLFGKKYSFLLKKPQYL